MTTELDTFFATSVPVWFAAAVIFPTAFDPLVVRFCAVTPPVVGATNRIENANAIRKIPATELKPVISLMLFIEV